jgi:hypothetical protein
VRVSERADRGEKMEVGRASWLGRVRERGARSEELGRAWRGDGLRPRVEEKRGEWAARGRSARRGADCWLGCFP